MDFKFKSRLINEEKSVDKEKLRCRLQFRMIKVENKSLPTLCVVYDSSAKYVTIKDIIETILKYAKMYYNGESDDKRGH